jgi:isopropylmalate/homocitrate/citramalate synthase
VDKEFSIPLEEQIANVSNGACLLELRDAFQGIPGLIYPNEDQILSVLQAAEQCDIMESTISIQTGDGSIVDQTTRNLLLKMRDLGDKCIIVPSFAIPSTAKGAAVAEDLIVNYHRGLEVKVFISAAEERMKVHGWTIDRITNQARETIQYLKDKYPNRVVSVIEQASQASDTNLFDMIDMSAEANASGVCLADTLSFFDQEQAFNFIFKIRKYIHEKALFWENAGDVNLASRYRKLRIEYHGHNDFGNASEAALGAMRAGAVVHTTPGAVNGIGERAGNASLRDTYSKANNFLLSHGYRPVKSVNNVDLLDEVFIAVTHADPSKYGPDGENANTTCAALHADYVLKIWKKLEAAKTVLEGVKARSDRPIEQLDLNGTDPGEIEQMMQVWEEILQKQVDEYSRLLKEGYLPRKGDQAYGEHRFDLNAFSNEDTIRMYYHEITGYSPYDLPQENVEYILRVIKHLNRPLTPLEVQQFLSIDMNDADKYPWHYVAETHPQYNEPMFQPGSN